jgi:hypothetical protein
MTEKLSQGSQPDSAENADPGVLAIGGLRPTENFIPVSQSRRIEIGDPSRTLEDVFGPEGAYIVD